MQVTEADEIDLEIILDNIDKDFAQPIHNSFLDTDERTAYSAWEMAQEEFGRYSYMANNRK